MTMFASSYRWLQRKRYQYEVTFSLYMLTPTEKFIFNSFLFIFVSMVGIAMTLYLPQHIAFLTNRAVFYYNGPEKAAMVAEGVRSVVENASATGVNMGKETALSAGARTMVEAAKEL